MNTGTLGEIIDKEDVISMSDNTFNDRLIDWLNTQGYPLEMNVAEVLQKMKYNVLQSEYFIDEESGNHREIDIVASLHKEIGNIFIRINFIVECKVSKEKPWVIFTSKNTRLAPPARIAQRAGSRAGKIILRNIAHVDEIQQLNLFSLPERPGYGLTQAFTSGNDVAYNPCVSVSKATRSIAKEYDAQRNERYVNISFPVIVIDGKLFETYLNVNNEMCVSEVNKGILLWRNPIVGMPHTVITVLTKDILEDYFSSVRADVMKIFDYIADNPTITSSNP
ncbi:hypothetical protein ABH897_004670 [Paenibacillus sp. RC73]|uniref:hypothetical protein n=1 Tax=Paenibacillus sp. RC73 TaxID=3156250 RepID=UPI0038364A3E